MVTTVEDQQKMCDSSVSVRNPKHTVCSYEVQVRDHNNMKFLGRNRKNRLFV